MKLEREDLKDVLLAVSVGLAIVLAMLLIYLVVDRIWGALGAVLTGVAISACIWWWISLHLGRGLAKSTSKKKSPDNEDPKDDTSNLL
jgi:hypothetical protein